LSITMEIDWAHGVVEFRVSGAMTPMAIVDGLAMLRASPQGQKLRAIVWDMRGTSLDNLDVEGLAATLQATPLPDSAVPNLRIAAVVDEGKGVKIATEWIEMGRSLDVVERQVFLLVADARAWARQSTVLDEPTPLPLAQM